VYWIPLYEILEERGLKVYLVNARHTKNHASLHPRIVIGVGRLPASEGDRLG
jgi:hypothetical protein